MPKKVKKQASSKAAVKKSPTSSYSKKEKSFFSDTVRGLGVLLALFVLVGYGIVFYLSNKPSIMTSCKETQQYIATHHAELTQLLTTSFDEASKCPENAPNCIADNIQKLALHFPDKGELSDYGSTYFIRAEGEEHISKLFLSGLYKKDPADTPKEKEVMQVLKGKRKDICASGLKTDVSFTTMTYLKDFIVEAEIIEPVKDGDKVIGAVVRLYGD